MYQIADILDMEPLEAARIYKIGKLIESIAAAHGNSWVLGTGFLVTQIQPGPEFDRPIENADLQSVRLFLAGVQNECKGLGLARSVRYAEDIAARTTEDNHPITYREFGRLLRELDKHIRWDMEEETFMYIPPSSAKFYNLEKPMGERVFESFPSARFDLRQAGNCLACGAHTASGLHLMRAAEIALWELGRDRQIPLAQSGKIEFAEWGTIIGELEKAVMAIQQWPNSSTKEDAHRFYNRTLVEIRSFNDGIRRHLAHVRKQQVPIEEDEALANWGHVKRFMETLADKIGEGKYTPPIW